MKVDSNIRPNELLEEANCGFSVEDNDRALLRQPGSPQEILSSADVR